MINEKYAKSYCKEDISKIENYDKAFADTTQTWVCHHRTEIWWNCSQKDLIENECYYDRKALELIFLTEEEHKSLHNAGERNPMYGKPSAMRGKAMPDEAKKRIAEARKGIQKSDETRKKMSEAKKAYYAAKRKAQEK